MQSLGCDKSIRRQPILRILAIAVTLAVIAAVGSSGWSVSAAPPVKKVLIIYPRSIAHPFFTDFTNGFRKVLRENSLMQVEVYYETLEILKYATDDTLARDTAKVLGRKYKNNRPDIIVTTSEYMSDYLQRYCPNIFGDIPVVAFSARPIYIPSELQGANFTFFYPAFKTAKNVELILALKPSTERLYVVIGHSKDEQKVREELPEQLAPFAGRLAITYLDESPMAEMLERVKNIEGQAAILFVDFLKDVTGADYVPVQVASSIRANAKVPVFLSYSSHVSISGAVGGYVVNANNLGWEVGERTLAILNGEATLGKIETMDLAEYWFDWNELQRWQIDEGKLPAGSIILNKPLSLWETHKWSIVVGAISLALLVMILQAGVISVLRRKRRKAEAELQRLDRLNLVGEMAVGIGHEVRNPMTTVRGYLPATTPEERRVQRV